MDTSYFTEFVLQQLAKGPLDRIEMIARCVAQFPKQKKFDWSEFLTGLVSGNVVIEIQYILAEQSHSVKSLFFSNDTQFRVVNFMRA